MRSLQRTIAIIGGGFSGTVLAVNLLRQSVSQPTRIVLIERRAQIGRGIAYQDNDHPHLLNVPAARMSADSRDPLQFVRFAQQRDAACDAQQYLPRALYGEYLQALLRQAQREAGSHISLQCVHAQAEALYPIEPKGPYLVSLSNQQRLLADDVVLACGDPPPADPACAVQLAEHCAYLRDPFGGPALRSPTATVLLIGTGLTMADVAVATAALNPSVRIHAVSRHGLLPAAQTVGATAPPAVADLSSRLPPGPASARLLLRAFRSLVSDMEAGAGDWRDAVNVARPAVPQLWSGMSVRERARFLRHARAYWDVHRHRMPPVIDRELEHLRCNGQLQVHAGHLLPLTASGERIVAQWRVRGSATTVSLEVDRVINCAGTDRRLTRSRDPLLQGLMAAGLAVPDTLGLGWRTDERGALIDRSGRVGRHLYYVGPMLRARHWEATAVGELRGHVERLAQVLIPPRARELATARRLPGAVTDPSRRCTSPQP